MADTRRGWLMVAGFVACALLVGLRWLAPLDLQVTVLVQRFGRHWLDEALFGFTLLGSIESTCAIVGVIGVWLWARGRRRAALAFWAAFATMALIEAALKFTLPQPHVPEAFNRSPASGVLLFHLHTPYAFPSGHTIRSVFILGYLAYLIGRRPRAVWRRLAHLVLWTIVALVCISRVYLGNHWASDVIGGMLLAAAGLWWMQRRQPRVSSP